MPISCQIYPYVIKVEKKVEAKLEAHQAKLFQLWLEQGKLSCVPNYALASTLPPQMLLLSSPSPCTPARMR